MDRLEQIKNAVTANGMREWTDERVGQAMREYADQQNEELRERVKELQGALTATLNVARACDRGRFVNILDKAEKALKK